MSREKTKDNVKVATNISTSDQPKPSPKISDDYDSSHSSEEELMQYFPDESNIPNKSEGKLKLRSIATEDSRKSVDSISESFHSNNRDENQHTVTKQDGSTQTNTNLPISPPQWLPQLKSQMDFLFQELAKILNTLDQYPIFLLEDIEHDLAFLKNARKVVAPEVEHRNHDLRVFPRDSTCSCVLQRESEVFEDKNSRNSLKRNLITVMNAATKIQRLLTPPFIDDGNLNLEYISIPTGGIITKPTQTEPTDSYVEFLRDIDKRESNYVNRGTLNKDRQTNFQQSEERQEMNRLNKTSTPEWHILTGREGSHYPQKNESYGSCSDWDNSISFNKCKPGEHSNKDYRESAGTYCTRQKGCKRDINYQKIFHDGNQDKRRFKHQEQETFQNVKNEQGAKQQTVFSFPEYLSALKKYDRAPSTRQQIAYNQGGSAFQIPFSFEDYCARIIKLQNKFIPTKRQSFPAHSYPTDHGRNHIPQKQPTGSKDLKYNLNADDAKLIRNLTRRNPTQGNSIIHKIFQWPSDYSNSQWDEYQPTGFKYGYCKCNDSVKNNAPLKCSLEKSNNETYYSDTDEKHRFNPMVKYRQCINSVAHESRQRSGEDLLPKHSSSLSNINENPTEVLSSSTGLNGTHFSKNLRPNPEEILFMQSRSLSNTNENPAEFLTLSNGTNFAKNSKPNLKKLLLRQSQSLSTRNRNATEFSSPVTDSNCVRPGHNSGEVLLGHSRSFKNTNTSTPQFSPSLTRLDKLDFEKNSRHNSEKNLHGHSQSFSNINRNPIQLSSSLIGVNRDIHSRHNSEEALHGQNRSFENNNKNSTGRSFSLIPKAFSSNSMSKRQTIDKDQDSPRN